MPSSESLSLKIPYMAIKVLIEISNAQKSVYYKTKLKYS